MRQGSRVKEVSSIVKEEEQENGNNTAPLVLQSETKWVEDEEADCDGMACSKDSSIVKEVGGVRK